MPTYSYSCKSCEHEFEELQSISEERLLRCPSCGKDELMRMIGGGSGLVFKGSGFYLTDYKKSSTSPATSDTKTKEKQESSPVVGQGATSGKEKKSETKAEVKSDTKAGTTSDSKSKE